MFEILMGCIIAAILTGIVRCWVLAHAWRLDRVRFHRAHFFSAAHGLLRDDRIDIGMLELIKKMTASMDTTEEFNAIMNAVMSLDKLVRSGKYHPRTSDPPLPSDWAVLLFNYFLAVSYSRMIRGWLLRNALVSVLDPKDSGPNTIDIGRRIHPPLLQPA
jgi:hypothetical protein